LKLVPVVGYCTNLKHLQNDPKMNKSYHEVLLFIVPPVE
jgi:hypothetical protein